MSVAPENLTEKSVFTVHEAKTNLSRLIAAALEGKKIVIARGKTPVAELVALRDKPPARRRPGIWKGKIEYADDAFDPWTSDDLGNWEDSPLG